MAHQLTPGDQQGLLNALRRRVVLRNCKKIHPSHNGFTPEPQPLWLPANKFYLFSHVDNSVLVPALTRARKAYASREPLSRRDLPPRLARDLHDHHNGFTCGCGHHAVEWKVTYLIEEEPVVESLCRECAGGKTTFGHKVVERELIYLPRFFCPQRLREDLIHAFVALYVAPRLGNAAETVIALVLNEKKGIELFNPARSLPLQNNSFASPTAIPSISFSETTTPASAPSFKSVPPSKTSFSTSESWCVEPSWSTASLGFTAVETDFPPLPSLACALPSSPPSPPQSAQWGVFSEPAPPRVRLPKVVLRGEFVEQPHRKSYIIPPPLDEQLFDSGVRVRLAPPPKPFEALGSRSNRKQSRQHRSHLRTRFKRFVSRPGYCAYAIFPRFIGYVAAVRCGPNPRLLDLACVLDDFHLDFPDGFGFAISGPRQLHVFKDKLSGCRFRFDAWLRCDPYLRVGSEFPLPLPYDEQQLPSIQELPAPGEQLTEYMVGGAGNCWLALPFMPGSPGVPTDAWSTALLQIAINEREVVPCTLSEVRYYLRDYLETDFEYDFAVGVGFQNDGDLHITHCRLLQKRYYSLESDPDMSYGYPLSQLYAGEFTLKPLLQFLDEVAEFAPRRRAAHQRDEMAVFKDDDVLVGNGGSLTVNPIDTAIAGVRTAPTIAAIEARTVDSTLRYIPLMRRICPWRVPAGLQEFLRGAGIPYGDSVVESHPAPVHAAVQRWLHYHVFPSFITTNCSLYHVDDFHFQITREMVPVDIELTPANNITHVKDPALYNADTLSPNGRSLSSTTDAVAIICRNGQKWTPHDVNRLFAENEQLTTAYFNVVFPAEALSFDYSCQLKLYKFDIAKNPATKQKTILYYAENDGGNHIEFPASAVWWLLTYRIAGYNFELFVQNVWSKGPFHVFLVTKLRREVNAFGWYPQANWVSVPKVFRNQLHKNELIPAELLRSLILYAQSLSSRSERDLWAKARMSKGILDDASVPLPVLQTLVAVVRAWVALNIKADESNRFPTSFLGLLNYKTFGALARVTTGKLQMKWHRKYVTAINDAAAINRFPLQVVRVRKAQDSIVFGDLADFELLSHDPWWRRIFEGLLTSSTQNPQGDGTFVMVSSFDPAYVPPQRWLKPAPAPNQDHLARGLTRENKEGPASKAAMRIPAQLPAPHVPRNAKISPLALPFDDAVRLPHAPAPPIPLSTKPSGSRSARTHVSSPLMIGHQFMGAGAVLQDALPQYCEPECLQHHPDGQYKCACGLRFVIAQPDACHKCGSAIPKAAMWRHPANHGCRDIKCREHYTRARWVSLCRSGAFYSGENGAACHCCPPLPNSDPPPPPPPGDASGPSGPPPPQGPTRPSQSGKNPYLNDATPPPVAHPSPTYAPVSPTFLPTESVRVSPSGRVRFASPEPTKPASPGVSLAPVLAPDWVCTSGLCLQHAHATSKLCFCPVSNVTRAFCHVCGNVDALNRMTSAHCTDVYCANHVSRVLQRLCRSGYPCGPEPCHCEEEVSTPPHRVIPSDARLTPPVGGPPIHVHGSPPLSPLFQSPLGPDPELLPPPTPVPFEPEIPVLLPPDVSYVHLPQVSPLPTAEPVSLARALHLKAAGPAHFQGGIVGPDGSTVYPDVYDSYYALREAFEEPETASHKSERPRSVRSVAWSEDGDFVESASPPPLSHVPVLYERSEPQRIGVVGAYVLAENVGVADLVELPVIVNVVSDIEVWGVGNRFSLRPGVYHTSLILSRFPGDPHVAARRALPHGADAWVCSNGACNTHSPFGENYRRCDFSPYVLERCCCPASQRVASHCPDPNCLQHNASLLPDECPAGLPYRDLGQVCHACCDGPPVYHHSTDYALNDDEIIASGGAAAPRSVLGHVFKLDGVLHVRCAGSANLIPYSLPDVLFLDRLFPLTVEKRHNRDWLGKPQPLARVHPPTKENCLLQCFSQLTGQTEDSIWNLLHWLSVPKDFHYLQQSDCQLNLRHLEALSLYFNLNVRLDTSKHDVGSSPWFYGTTEGPPVHITFRDAHFSVRDDKNLGYKSWSPTRKRGIRTPAAASLRSNLINTTGLRPRHWKPDWPRAEAYIRALSKGTTGTRLSKFGEETLKCWEEACEKGLAENRHVELITVYGNPGSGKTYPIQELLRSKQLLKRWNQDSVYCVVTPTTVLRQEWAQGLDLRQKRPDGKGTPSQYCLTFEEALESKAEVIIIDELGKYPPGYVSALVGLNPNCCLVVLLGDSEQTTWHEPNADCLLNNVMPEVDYFAPHCQEYWVGTHRLPVKLANFFNIPTTSTDFSSGFRHRQILEPGIPAIVASRASAIETAVLAGVPSVTMPSCQGMSYSAVQVVIDRNAIMLADQRALWTALSRSKGPCYIVWSFTASTETTRAINANPILRVLYSYRNHVDDSPTRTNIDICEIQKNWNRAYQARRVLRLEHSGSTKRITNHGRFDRSRCLIYQQGRMVPYDTDPTGGAASPLQEDYFDEDSTAPKTFYSQVRQVAYREPVLAPCAPAHILARVHFARVSREYLDENHRAQVPERFDQELRSSKFRPGGDYSTQKEDIPKLRRDQRRWQRMFKKLRASGMSEVAAEEAIAPFKFVDMISLAPFHQMSRRDRVAFSVALKKRVSFASPTENKTQYQSALQDYGPALWSSIVDLIPALNHPIPWDQEAYEEECLNHEYNRLRTKSRAALNAARGRAEPEWQDTYWQIDSKSEFKAKMEKMFKDSIALQTLVTTSDKVLFMLGGLARYITRFLLANVPRNLLLYIGFSPSQLNDIVSDIWLDRLSQANDFSQFDSLQDAGPLAAEMALMERLQVPSQLSAYYLWTKTESTSQYGDLAIMRLTGEVFTFVFNTLFNLAITNVRFELSTFVRSGRLCAFGGDDSIINGVLAERGTWVKYARQFENSFKLEYTTSPTFCSWRFTSHGIFKDPILLYARMRAKDAMGLRQEVFLSYLYEWSFAFRLGDVLVEYANEEELEYHTALSSVFLRSSFPVYDLLSGWDRPPEVTDVRTEIAQLTAELELTPSYLWERLVTGPAAAIAEFFAPVGDQPEEEAEW